MGQKILNRPEIGEGVWMSGLESMAQISGWKDIKGPFKIQDQSNSYPDASLIIPLEMSIKVA